jgi:tRNA 2-selenouridine synthase
MPRSPEYTQQPWFETYSEIIDVRSESEFAEDRMPGAINLPVLDDAERAKVGTLYKQVCPFDARKVGASLVAQNIAKHLNTHFISKDKNYRPLLYCWRGGQRSNSMALVLSQIGWHVTVLEGGYKTYRTYVRDRLENLPAQFTYRVLCGLTGSGKTDILRQLAHREVQVLDLEGLANHRGSLLGQEWENGSREKNGAGLTANQQASSSTQSGKFSPQPSQKRFESLLLEQLQRFDTSKPVWVEAESNKIGQVYLPPSLWQQIKQASCIEIELPQAARIENLLKEYPHLVTHPDLLKGKLERLKSRYGRKKSDEWYSLIDAGLWHALVGDLLSCHYDPAYRQSIGQCYHSIERQLQITDLSDASVNALLDALISFG